MARVPNPARFDLASSWSGAVERVNTFFREVRNALDGRLSVKDNLLMEWREIPFTGGDADVVVRTRFQQPVKGCSIQYAAREDGTAIATALHLDWAPATDGTKAAVKIRSITGLASGERHTLRLLVIGA